MNSLWPSDLLVGAEPEPLRTLRQQADALAAASAGRLIAGIDQQVLEGIIIYSFVIAARGRTGSDYELLRARTPTGTLPCVIEVNHLEGDRLHAVSSPGELAEKLQRISSAPRTREIIRILVEHAVDSEPETPLSIVGEPVLLKDGTKLFGISCFGSFSYISMETAVTLAGGTMEELFEPLGNDLYVAQIPLAAPMRRVVSLVELVRFRNSIKEALLLIGQ